MILTVGDSVTWGQGLLEEHKFDTLLAAQKKIPLIRRAHSGAVIGTRNDTSRQNLDPEVPVSAPTIWQQVLHFNDWPHVQLLLLNGGINDISLTRILNPATTTAQLEQLVEQFCNYAMAGLLTAAGQRLVLPGARIAVPGYFPILSSKSGGTHLQMQAILETQGLGTTFGTITNGDRFAAQTLKPHVVQNCLIFWHAADIALQKAVATANANLHAPTCIFVKLPFSEDNALWAPHPLLWELSSTLEPTDEVSASRGARCTDLYGDLDHLFQWIQCKRASLGHPNVEGAAIIASTIAEALKLAA